MSWTLAELSKIETDPLRKSVYDGILLESNLLELFPFDTIGKLSEVLTQYANLPTFGYRKINEGFAESTGKFKQKSESISLGGLDIDTDKAIARAKNTIADARAIQQVMALKSAAFQFNWKFISGNPTTDPEEFKGIRLRIDDIKDDGFTDQKIQATNTTSGINNSSSNSHDFLNDLDKLVYAINGHDPTYLLMNKKTLLAVRSLLRKEKLLDQSQDQFGRKIDMYGNARMIDIGTRVDEVTEIILTTETAAGAPSGGTENTSIYACKFEVGIETWGIQEYPMEVTDLGELQSAPKFRTRIDWPHGMATMSHRSLARLYGVVPDSSS